MSREETFIIATLLSVTGIAAELYGADVQEWVFPVSSLVLVVVISLEILPVLVRSRLCRGKNTEALIAAAGSDNNAPLAKDAKDFFVAVKALAVLIAVCPFLSYTAYFIGSKYAGLLNYLLNTNMWPGLDGLVLLGAFWALVSTLLVGAAFTGCGALVGLFRLRTIAHASQSRNG
ncbi:hypothetical protein [Marinobacter sp. F3R08]|uniref:hypothetical protein n=1 Tax=Marinobacter sp. F3R08 TaxID=2841559 RepID=UPI001C092001|nr:hypothetical protein [Marinobacter sp. F3R08]MBU2952254.1 hypothetical protein [Marinobacter sp. F3R08]